jgi:hypothetical protein
VALAVAASLPGGDPLAAALAAGDAVAGRWSPPVKRKRSASNRTRRRRGRRRCVGDPRRDRAAERLRSVPLDKPPAVLADRARQILNAFGYTIQSRTRRTT